MGRVHHNLLVVDNNGTNDGAFFCNSDSIDGRLHHGIVGIKSVDCIFAIDVWQDFDLFCLVSVNGEQILGLALSNGGRFGQIQEDPATQVDARSIYQLHEWSSKKTLQTQGNAVLLEVVAGKGVFCLVGDNPGEMATWASWSMALVGDKMDDEATTPSS